jgi:hypothetical protein
MKQKQALLFVNKKKQKNFIYAGAVAFGNASPNEPSPPSRHSRETGNLLIKERLP